MNVFVEYHQVSRINVIIAIIIHFIIKKITY